MSSSRKGLFLKYEESKKQQLKEEKIKSKYGLEQEEKVVIEKNNSLTISLVNIIFDIIGKILKFAFYIAIIILVTIGATILINAPYRDEIIKLFSSLI